MSKVLKNIIVIFLLILALPSISWGATKATLDNNFGPVWRQTMIDYGFSGKLEFDPLEFTLQDKSVSGAFLYIRIFNNSASPKKYWNIAAKQWYDSNPNIEGIWNPTRIFRNTPGTTDFVVPPYSTKEARYNFLNEVKEGNKIEVQVIAMINYELKDLAVMPSILPHDSFIFTYTEALPKISAEVINKRYTAKTPLINNGNYTKDSDLENLGIKFSVDLKPNEVNPYDKGNLLIKVKGPAGNILKDINGKDLALPIDSIDLTTSKEYYPKNKDKIDTMNKWLKLYAGKYVFDLSAWGYWQQYPTEDDPIVENLEVFTFNLTLDDDPKDEVEISLISPENNEKINRLGEITFEWESKPILGTYELFIDGKSHGVLSTSSKIIAAETWGANTKHSWYVTGKKDGKEYKSKVYNFDILNLPDNITINSTINPNPVRISQTDSFFISININAPGAQALNTEEFTAEVSMFNTLGQRILHKVIYSSSPDLQAQQIGDSREYKLEIRKDELAELSSGAKLYFIKLQGGVLTEEKLVKGQGAFIP